MKKVTLKKPFSCPECGAVDDVAVHGEWIDQKYMGLVFDVIRADSENYQATLNDTRSSSTVRFEHLPRVLSDAEIFAMQGGKYQCTKCNQIIFPTVTKVTGAPVVDKNKFGPVIPRARKRDEVEQMFLKHFSSEELSNIIQDMGYAVEIPRDLDKVTIILNKLYS